MKQNDLRITEQKAEVDKVRKQLEAFRDLCKSIGEPEDNVALAWILANPAVTCPIIGPETVEHLEASYKALDLVLNSDMMKKLDEIFPGPGGMAPEAYAW